MQIRNFGSLNIDEVYTVNHIVQPGETLASSDFRKFPGGKGLNQSLAIARAGGRVSHVGAIGNDGQWLRDLLRTNGVDTAGIRTIEAPSGRAIIQVETTGQNSIILFGGANRRLPVDHIETALALGKPGDFVLVQNETNDVDRVLSMASRQGMHVCFNPAPMGPEVLDYPLDCVNLLILNETEGQALAGSADMEDVGAVLCRRFPSAEILLTLGKNGSILFKAGRRYRVNALPVKAVDTTGAGDTFIGYFLAGIQAGLSPERCLERAARAAAISVTRPGAAESIPKSDEVDGWQA